MCEYKDCYDIHRCVFNFVRNCQTVFQCGFTIYVKAFPPANYENFSSSVSLPAFGISNFHVSHSNRHKVVSHCCFHFLWLMVLKIFLCAFFAIFVSSLVKLSTQILCHFLSWVLWFWTIKHRDFFIYSGYGLCFVGYEICKYFLWSVACLFDYLSVSFVEIILFNFLLW